MIYKNNRREWINEFLFFLAEENGFMIVGKRHSSNNKAIRFDDMEYKIPMPKPVFTDQSYIDNKEDDFNDYY